MDREPDDTPPKLRVKVKFIPFRDQPPAFPHGDPEDEFEAAVEELYCHGCGERLADTGFLAIRSDWDALEVVDEWLACSRACVNKIVADNGLELIED
jgi:hypothetical protein